MKRHTLPLLLTVVLAVLLSACGGRVIDAGPLGPDDDPDTPSEPDEPAPDEPSDDDADPDADDPESDEPDGSADEPTEATTAVRLYFLAPGGGTPARADPFLVSVTRDIPSTQRIALATLRELVAGPTSADEALVDGIATAVPDATLVLDVRIDGGLATVDLSREFESGGGSLSMFARLAQVVATLTQFPTVDEVAFTLDGQPVTVFSGEGIVLDAPVSRDDYLDLLPTVFVDTPAAGAEVTTPLRITGLAAVFEATFQYRVEATDGTLLAEGFAMSDNGMGWGSFDVTIDVDVDAPTPAELTVWEYSAMDGSVQAERVTPLVLLP